jgi:hypothetical protein
MRLILSTMLLALSTVASAADKPIPLFDGKTFTGWEGDTKTTWRIEDGAIVGGSLETNVPRYEYL